MIRRHIRAALLAGAALLPFADAAHAEQKSGSWTSKFTKQEAQPMSGPNDLLVAQIAVGTNKGRQGDPYLDGARVVFSEILHLNNGNGPQTGTISILDDKGANTSQYSGTVTTTMVDGKPRTTGQGTWTLKSGVGVYKGIAGSGTYTFTMVAQDEVAGEWKGDVTLPTQ